MKSTTLLASLRSTASVALAAFTLTVALPAADHRDAPTLAHDAATDLADVYFFMDPNNTGTNDRAIVIVTFHGFIVPGEAVNEAIFDHNVRYHFEFFNDHVNFTPPAADATKREKAQYVSHIRPARTIDVTFTPRTGGEDPNGLAGKEALEIAFPQQAVVQFAGFPGINKKDKFTADCLDPNLSGTPQVPMGVPLLDKNGQPMAQGIDIFAGECDDPFFFDIPGFGGFIKSIRETGTPDTTKLDRGRDTFAGYNALAIALSIPVTHLVNPEFGPKVGVQCVAQRHNVQMPTRGTIKGVGAYKAVDRMGNPAVNVVLVPFTQKNAYNGATPRDDAELDFAGGILGTLGALGTTGSAFDPMTNVGLLADIAVRHGDLLTLNTSVANTGMGGGDNAGAGFPNGRRLKDDVVDTLISVVTNGALTTGDHVNANDGTFQSAFPFLAPTQQPRPRIDMGGTDVNVDDNTRN